MTEDSGIVTGDSGQSRKSVTFNQNLRSRSVGTTGHVQTESAVNIARNTQVDMRRSFDGLCATITEALGGDPLSGDVFLFRGKRADRLKAIAWDRTGLAIWYKRLERGKFKWPSRDAVSIELT